MENIQTIFPSKIEWDLTNGPIGYSGLGVRSVGSVGDFLISWNFGRLLVVLFFGSHESCFFLDFFSPGIGG